MSAPPSLPHGGEVGHLAALGERDLLAGVNDRLAQRLGTDMLGTG